MNNDVAKITQTLSNISMIMGDGYKFLKIRMICERWEKEAANGNESSKTLIEIIERFHRVINLIDEIKNNS